MTKVHSNNNRGKPGDLKVWRWTFRRKYAVSQVIGYIKGKRAIHIARTYSGRKRNFAGQHFWARGYFVSTVGQDEEVIRSYIRHQEDVDRRVDQLALM